MNWLEIKALNELYHQGEVRINSTLSKSSEFKYLEQSYGVLRFSTKAILREPGFEDVYERLYLPKYQLYLTFLQKHDLLRPQTRFDSKELDILIDIDKGMDSGELMPVRDQIVTAEESVRGVSEMFFRHEKYLDTRMALVDALRRLLIIEKFANDKDQQYIYRLECHKPKAIVLCENLDFLRRPNRPRAAHLQLWYAGGKNVDKLNYAETNDLPIYYSCDWDYDGLFVIYPIVKQIIPTITLLRPNGSPKSIVKTEHGSQWEAHRLADATYRKLFDKEELDQIDQLARNNEWIIEESNDLIEMFRGMNKR